jgi:hypothetical protein
MTRRGGVDSVRPQPRIEAGAGIRITPRRSPGLLSQRVNRVDTRCWGFPEASPGDVRVTQLVVHEV